MIAVAVFVARRHAIPGLMKSSIFWLVSALFDPPKDDISPESSVV